MDNQKMILAINTLKLMFEMLDQREDYSYILAKYNDLVDTYNLPLKKYKWVSSSEITESSNYK